MNQDEANTIAEWLGMLSGRKDPSRESFPTFEGLCEAVSMLQIRLSEIFPEFDEKSFMDAWSHGEGMKDDMQWWDKYVEGLIAKQEAGESVI